ncbi:MAG: phospho-N-acetylmuramoyl-pentapeptide-transferase [Clostridia bacterium]|nr:phospho-N-acetylmuramoyl-pentapeptide-transferase [Clostridia bacterium]
MKTTVLCLLIAFFCFFITVIVERKLIPFLSNKAKQPIYEDGPNWHIKKTGTPTMGGLAFILSVISVFALLCLYLFFFKKNTTLTISILIALLFSAANAMIGIIDDLTKLRKKENAGITPLQKLGLQLILAVIFLMARKHFFNDSTILEFSFGSFDIGFFYYPLAIILILGIINCANLTDGVDGLASCVAATIGLSFCLITPSFLESVKFVGSAMLGAGIGFLLFNRHPARVFMGDTGSLFLGALAVAGAFTLNSPFAIILLGGVYVIEGISVILQVIFFKLTGRRLFKMSPLHHHLEKCGYSENKICLIAILTTVLTSLLSILIFKI